jgi:hypothetical protein
MKLKVGNFLVRYKDGSETMLYGLYDCDLVLDYNSEWEVDIVHPGATILASDGEIFVHEKKLTEVVDFWNRTR